MKLKYLLILLAIVLPLATFAAYNDVTLGGASNSYVTVGTIPLGVTGSNAEIESISVSDSDFSVTLAAGSSIKVTSADRYKIGFTQGTSVVGGFTCDDTTSYLELSLSSSYAGSSTAITVTPTATACTKGGSSGGGGGGGGVSSVVVPTTVATSTVTTTAATKVTPKTKCLKYAIKKVAGKKVKVCTKYAPQMVKVQVCTKYAIKKVAGKKTKVCTKYVTKMVKK